MHQAAASDYSEAKCVLVYCDGLPTHCPSSSLCAAVFKATSCLMAYGQLSLRCKYTHKIQLLGFFIYQWQRQSLGCSARASAAS